MLPAIALLLAGCASARVTALPPPAPLPPALGTGEDRWPATAWWQGFGNAELSALIAEALDRNPDIAISAARIDQARARLRQARAPLAPALSLGASVSRQGSNSSSGAISGTYEDAALTASWEVDLWGRVRAQTASARATLAASRYDAEGMRVSITTTVADGWLTVLELRDRRRAALSSLDIARSLLRLTEARAAAGAALTGEVAAQRTLVATAEAAIPTLDQAEVEALAGLALLLGRPAQGFAVATPGVAPLGALPPLDPTLPAELLQRRPDLAASEARLAAAGADVRAARAAMLPAISLTASGGGQVGSGPSSALYTLIANLAQPIFDNGALRSRRDLAIGLRREAEAGYRKAVLTALSETEITLKRVATSERILVARIAAADAAATALSQSEVRYRAGTEIQDSVLTDQRALFSARDEAARASGARLRAMVALYGALGGGWRRDARP